MKRLFTALATASLLALAPLAAPAAETAGQLDIKKAVPASAYFVTYAKHNPERDYQREYFKEAWDTFREERIAEKVFDIIKSRAPKEKLEKFQDGWKEVREALEPINLEALGNAQEVVFAEAMIDKPINQVLMVVRLTEEDAADYEKGVGQLFALVEKWSDGKVKVEEGDVDDVKITSLKLPKEAPMSAAVAKVGDVFLASTDVELLRTAITQMHDESAVSKFDDPRLIETLKHMPEPEDTLVFFDGAELFKNMRGIGDMMREEAKKKGEHAEEKVEKIASIFETVIDHCAIIDYTVVVEYTEDGQNRSAEVGKLADGYEDKVLGKALASGQAFEDWQSWIPADATSYKLSTGVNLHVLYDGVMELVRDEFPESHEGLEKFEEVQDKVGVHLDKDILQSFSGESVSVMLPAANGAGSPQSITALRCTNPDRIGELIERGVTNLKNLPALDAQKLELVDCDDLEGFKEIKATLFQMVGAQPVYDFKDGWMILGSTPAAVEKLLAVRAGDEDSIADAESFKQFNLKVGDEVYAASYSDVGGGVRAVADTIDKVAGMAPAFVMMAQAQSQGQLKPEDMSAINEAIGLLPSIAKVIRKFDFMEHRLSVTHDGPLPDSYMRETVTIIRQPDEEKESEKAGN